MKVKLVWLIVSVLDGNPPKKCFVVQYNQLPSVELMLGDKIEKVAEQLANKLVSDYAIRGVFNPKVYQEGDTIYLVCKHFTEQKNIRVKDFWIWPKENDDNLDFLDNRLGELVYV